MLTKLITTLLQSLAASTTDPKDLVFLGKTVEALNVADTVSSIISEGDTQIAAVQAEGTTQVAAVAAQGANYAPLAGATFTGAVTGTDLTLSGNLTVSGTTTTINSATLNVADTNITIADGAATPADANGAGITIDGAGVNFQYSNTGKHMSLDSTLKLDSIKEAVTIDSTTTGGIQFRFIDDSAVYFFNVDQTANRTINFRGNASNGLDAIMSVGDSMTAAILMQQGSTAYYLNSFTVDGTAVTPKWQGGSAPTGGNASGIDVYTFTIIKTAAATFTVLASQTQFA